MILSKQDPSSKNLKLTAIKRKFEEAVRKCKANHMEENSEQLE